MEKFPTLDLKHFDKFDQFTWDSLIAEMGYVSPYHTYNDIKYHLSTNQSKNLSCIFFKKEIPIILLPLSIFKNELIFPDKPCPIFLVNKKHNTKNNINYVLNYIRETLVKYKLKRYVFSDHPFTKYPIEKKNYQNIRVKNVESLSRLILDLKLSESQLFKNLSKSLRKTINKSEKYFLFKVINYKNSSLEIYRYMRNLKKSHFLAAKRKTRSDLSWRLMTKFIKQNNGVLFMLKYKNKIVSYLYCGIYKNFSWGWTQVNPKKKKLITNFKFEPRHILEWKAITYLKQKNIYHYDIGDNYLDPKKNSVKELSISLFKRKFGSNEINKNIYYL